MADDERDAPLLLNMTMSSSTTENDSRRSSPDKDLTKTYDRHFSQSSHSGLSALLNAVTLQLSKSKEEEQEQEELQLELQLEQTKQWKKNGELSSSKGASFDNAKDGTLHTTTITTTTHPTLPQKQQSHSKATEAVTTSPTPTTTTTTATTTRVDTSSTPSLPSSFPQKLMTLLMNPNHENSITWLPDGKYFAVRSNGFHKTLIPTCFGMDSMETFLYELHLWGFALIETQCVGIEVFRHHRFRKGDWDQCQCMHRTNTYSDNDEIDPASEVPAKRRLSPGHRQCSEDSDKSSRKIRMQDSGSSDRAHDCDVVQPCRTKSKDYKLLLARAITTEKLQLQPTGTSYEQETNSLVQQAIVGATHTIVTDAIETLLNDEEHTRMCFAIHAEELSKSTIPGLVPITKQLFSMMSSASRHDENKTRGHSTRYNAQHQRDEEPQSELSTF